MEQSIKNDHSAVAPQGPPTTHQLQVAPVLERLVLPRARQALLRWLDELASLKAMRWLVPAHYSAPIAFSPHRSEELCSQLNTDNWAPSDANWAFLSSIDQRLLKLGVVPTDPQLRG